MKEKIKRIILFLGILSSIFLVFNSVSATGTLKPTEFIGLYNGAGLVRYCPSFNCKISKYGAMCPFTEVLYKVNDWYKVKFTERGIYDENAHQINGCGGDNGRILPQASWSTTEGWMPESVIPPDIRKLFISEEKKPDNISFELADNEIIRECPSFSCELVWMGTWGGKVILKGKQGEWYSAIVVNNKTVVETAGAEGWIHESIIPENVKQAFTTFQQVENLSQPEGKLISQSEGVGVTKEENESKNKSISLASFFKNKNVQTGLITTLVFIFLSLVFILIRKKFKIILKPKEGQVTLENKKIKSFIQTFFLLFRKKIKGIFQFKLSGITLPKIKFKQKSFVAFLPIILVITVGVAGISYGAVEYKKISGSVKEANQLVKEEKYNEANEKLKITENKWFVKVLGIQKEKISSEIEENKKLEEDKSKYTQGLDEFNKSNLQETVDLLSKLSENSFYYQKAQTKIEEAKRKMVEGELAGEKIAREEAEQRTKEEEVEKKIAQQELSEKEAEEQRLNADSDGDGLTYREELVLGISDLKSDSDGDGIDDGEDLHPAGGGRYLAQHFEWEYKGTVWTWNHSIHEDWYEYYKNKPRSPHGLEYVTPDDPFIQKIAEALKKNAEKKNYHLTSFIVSFVQGLPYIEDYYTSFDEYPKYPVETFIERNGDCEDTSYLFASLVQATGLGTVLIEFHNHMGVGVNTAHSQSGYYYPVGDKWYYYYETTGEDWEIGELPSDYLYENAKITKVWDNSIYYSYPKHIKPCDPSPSYSGYYYDGVNYYRDSNCTNQTSCLPALLYSDKYWDGHSFYWNSNCTQRVVSGCDKSVYHPGYFFDGWDYYYDYQCIQVANP